MNEHELIQLLIDNPGEQVSRLNQHVELANSQLARLLKQAYDSLESSRPALAASAAQALTALAEVTGELEVRALASWTAGMVTLDNGLLEEGQTLLSEAATNFEACGLTLDAAKTQVSQLRALAMLGRYDEALDCGHQARDVFVKYGDQLSAGKMEQNLGNLHFRRDRYPEAEQFYRQAQARFALVADQKQLAQIGNCLGTVLAPQQRFREAELSYQAALALAEAADLEVTRAEIECNLGCLAQFQGRYDQALDYLERSRRRYVALEMPHESAIAEQELADAYLELNLAPEAAAIYERVTPVFAALGMQAEQARALAYHGRTHLLLGQISAARARLAEAHALYTAEANPVGEATVLLIEAQIHQAEENYEAAAEAATQAETLLAAMKAWGRWLLARWLRGEAARAQGQKHIAQALLEETLQGANEQAVPQVAQRCYTSLGLLAATSGEMRRAEVAFRQAIELTEAMRAPLPAEEFRTAFVGDKLIPYAEMVRVCLADHRAERDAEALGYVERARSKALIDMLVSTWLPHRQARDAFEVERLARLEELREELNWLYSQINRPDSAASRGAETMMDMYQAVRQREMDTLEIERQLQQRGTHLWRDARPVDLTQLQQAIGPETALVEYYSLDGEWLAFVVTEAGLQVVERLGSEVEVETLLERLRFQLETFHFGTEQLQAHLAQLTRRALHHLQALYAILLQPLEELLGERRLLVVPHRALHYIPFHALHDGERYVIERREVGYAPSATVLCHCLAAPCRSLQRAVLVGVPDVGTPRLNDEVISLAGLFPEAHLVLAEHATQAALHALAPVADVLHLACHGKFRPDNPLFSAVRLADGWLTVRDAYSLKLQCELVTLSACETGMSQVAPGDELMGLARGFFSAGAPTLLVSLWPVDDEATARLMVDFYTHLLAGHRPGAALRWAQRQMLERYSHPFFWSPFVLLGRW